MLTLLVVPVVNAGTIPGCSTCIVKSNYGELYFSRDYTFDGASGTPSIILLNVTTTYQSLPNEELVYIATAYGNGTFDVRLHGPEPVYISRNGIIQTKGGIWNYIASNKTTTITGGSTILVSYHVLGLFPPPGGVTPEPEPSSPPTIPIPFTVYSLDTTIVIVGLAILMLAVVAVFVKRRLD